jgi:hypothetical protein
MAIQYPLKPPCLLKSCSLHHRGDNFSLYALIPPLIILASHSLHHTEDYSLLKESILFSAITIANYLYFKLNKAKPFQVLFK